MISEQGLEAVWRHWMPIGSLAWSLRVSILKRIMPINRTLWQSQISGEYIPNWPCPRCGATALTLAKDSFRTTLDSITSRNWDDPEFGIEFATGRFVCLLLCSRAGCEETCAVAGNYEMAQDDDEHGSRPYSTGRPSSIIPPPPLIQIPEGCPKPIQQEVVFAFALFWLDHSSALNRIRNAIELLLTEIGIKRHGKKPGGGRTRLPLDSRIQILRSKKPSLSGLCDRLLAVKHLGNAGSECCRARRCGVDSVWPPPMAPSNGVPK